MLDDYVIKEQRWEHPPAMRRCGEFSAPAADAKHEAGHTWVPPREPIPWEHCEVCGVVRRADGKNSEVCKGTPRIVPRDAKHEAGRSTAPTADGRWRDDFPDGACLGRPRQSSDFGRGGAAIEAAAAKERVAALEASLSAAEREREELRAFKTYVHQRLDEAGIPANPEPPKHALAGCRIGDRLDVALAARAALSGLVEAVEGFRPIAPALEAARHTLAPRAGEA